MSVSILVIAVLLALPVVTLCYTDQWLHLIYVDNQTQHGVDDPSCWTGGYSTPCRSLNLALTGAQHYNHSTAIFLQPGQHQLHGGSETQLRDMSQLAIVGNNSKGEVVVICEPLTGLAFSWSKIIEIKNIDFADCGVQIDTSMNILSTEYVTFLEIQIALYFFSCEGIYLTNVCVYESTGTGVAIYNPVGVVNIDKCQFIRNGLTLSELGGGGLVIEANERTSGSFCTISDTSFTQNTASNNHYLSNPDAYFGTGKGGGGILIVFRGGAVNNTVQLENVTLEKNIAQFGGGIFLGFFENASGNAVNINNGQVTQNMALLESRNFLSSAKGGGAFIGLVSSESEGVFNNTVTINNTRFDSNEAQMGGGISVHVFYDTEGCSCSTGGNKLLISNCIFSNNEAFQGASAYLSQSGDGVWGSQALDTTVHHSSFTGGHCVVSLMNGFGLPCRGNLLMVSYTLMLEDAVMFNGAQNLSALHLQYSSLKLLPFTKLEFHNNSAENGAALYFVDCSLILVNYNTSLLFQNNSVSNRGGAIYAETCKLHVDHANGKGCFIRHVNSALHPNQWGTEISFNENKARNKDNSIFVDSTKPCFWTDSSSSTKKDTFCWNGWSFQNKTNCNHSLFTSGPVSITGPTSYTVQPGGYFNLSDYELYDGWNNTFQSDLEVAVLSGTVSLGEPSCYDTSIPCFGYALLTNCSQQDYNNKSSVLLVHPPQFPGILVNISFELCDSETICFDGVCSEVYPYNWFSAYSTVCNKTSLQLLANCISCYDNYTVCDIFSQREGMCGSCDDPSFGVVFNFPSFICAKCEWYGYLVFLEFVPILLMMIILSVLHINIISGSMNGYILYSQLVSQDLPGLGSTAWLPDTINNTYYMNMKQFPTSVPLTVYSMWNLNFLTLIPVPLCIQQFDVVRVIVLEYVVAICPLLFILMTYLWIHWYNNGYRFVVYTTRPVHQLLARFWQKFKIHPTLIDTYAGLMLLAYMRILTVSTKIFITFGLQVHEKTLDVSLTVLVVLAILCILFFVVPMMVIFLFYHLNTFQRYLTWCKLDRPGLHALVDAYQGCFLNIATDGSERRFFAGVYLLFRLLYNVTTVVMIVIIINKLDGEWWFNSFAVNYTLVVMSMAFIMAGMILILRPYKKVVHNVIDFMVFLFMCPVPFLIVVIIDFDQNSNHLFSLRNVIFLPFLIFSFVILCKLLKYCCTKRSVAHQPAPDDERNPPSERTPLVTTAPTTTEVTLDDDYIEYSVYADRIVNPRRYNEEHNRFYGSIQESQPSTSAIARFQAPVLNIPAGDAKPSPSTV